MRSKPPLVHNAITLEMAKVLVVKGYKPEPIRYVSYAEDSQFVLILRHVETSDVRYVIDVTPELLPKRFKVAEIIDFMIESGLDDIKLTLPLLPEASIAPDAA